MELFLKIFFSIILVPGIAMTAIPMLPAIFYMFIVALIYGALDHFTDLTWQDLIWLFVIFLISFVVDHTAGVLGAKYGGASQKAILWGLVGLFFGSLIFFPFGGILGLAAGVLIAEMYAHRKHHVAIKAAAGSIAGAITGIAANLLLASIFFVLFLIFVWG